MRNLRHLIPAGLAVLVLWLPAVAHAAAPANDAFSAAVAIDPSALPFHDSLTIDEATLEPAEPSGCYVAGKSIWYSITPTVTGTLRADIGASTFFDRILYVYRQGGSGFDGLSIVACAGPYYNGMSNATFHVDAGTTYYLQVGGFYPSSSGTLSLSVESVPPPPNDDFGNATSVGSLPFTDNIDMSAATTEAGEPSSCGATAGSAWYAYTAATTGSVTAAVSSSFAADIAAYSGSSLASLNSKGCQYGRLTIHVDAGTTYYFQVTSFGSGGGPTQFQLAETQPPLAQLGWSPGDPSIFDSIQFYDASYDPAGVGFVSESWTFGDGATATGCCPVHRYGADGDYPVKLRVTTADGRSATTVQTFPVKTHDVTISKITVPQSARPDQTRQISVGITDSRYPETVQVQLLKSLPSGQWAVVGTSTQSVPVRGANRTTAFDFNYTFTADDASIGKVSFRAVASIQGARDALSNDNDVTALPTKVS